VNKTKKFKLCTIVFEIICLREQRMLAVL
jgi:hypothetical protein